MPPLPDQIQQRPGHPRLNRFVEHLLIGVSARDTFAFAAGVAAMAVSGIAASYVPALRASRIDLATALRSE